MFIADPKPSSPSVEYNGPLVMLTECHRRVENQCRTLARLAPYLQRHGNDATAVEAARAVMHYFDLAAPQHHADEENDLFPEMFEAVAGSDARCLRDISDALATDHRCLEVLWMSLRARLQDVATGRAVGLRIGDIRVFSASYATHIAREERELFPMVARLLSDEAIQRLETSMRRRRGEEI